MIKHRTKRIISLLLAVLFCFPPMQSISAENELNVPEAVFDNYGIDMMLPIEGELDVASTDYYYENKNDSLPGLHGGLDIICDKYTPILAISDAVVNFVGSGGGYGNNVILEHTGTSGEKFYSRYAHLTSYKVKAGEKVTKGQVVGLAGSTGSSYTNHLHLEIYTSKNPTNLERSYTTKYLLSLPVSELARMSFYYQPINGEYNSQLRKTRLGSGGSCYDRCARDDMHDHISKYALYLEKFYNRSPYSWNCRYYFDTEAEAGLFADPVLREHIYKRYDTDNDGHLSYVEVMRVTALDLRGLNITSLEGLDLFENLSTVLTGEGEVPLDPPDVVLPEAGDPDAVYTLSAEYKIDPAYVKTAGLLGLWEHIDDDGELPLRKNPVYNTDYAGAGIPHLGRFVVTETKTDATYTWGKTVYNGVEGWVIISNTEWTRQLTSGAGIYTVDSEGYLITTATGERVKGALDSTKTAGELFDVSLVDCLTDGKSITAWSYNGTVPTEKTKLTTIISELRSGNVNVVFNAYFGESPASPLHELEAELRLPEEGRMDYGALGAWYLTANVNLRSSPDTDGEQLVTIPKDSTVIVTATNIGSEYLWGKVTYNGNEGWCALSDEWAEQKTVGFGRYGIDEEGYIIFTGSGNRVKVVYTSDTQVSELPDLAEMQLINGLYIFDGWSADGKTVFEDEAALSTVFEELKNGDHTTTLTAVLSLDTSPDLTVSYKLPSASVKDAGGLGLWEHIDDDGELPLRKEPSKTSEKTGAGIPHLGRFTVTEIKTDTETTWGKTEYNGSAGWVIIGNSAWTRQLTSGEGIYAVDGEGYLVYTATGERVQSELDAEMTLSALLDGVSIDCLKDNYELTAWQYLGSALSGGDTPFTEIFPSLGSRKLRVTLTAQVKNKINRLSVNYVLPAESVKDAGLLGLWMHTDTTGPLSIRTDHNAKTDKIGEVPASSSFMITETYNDGQYLWGKTTCGGVTGWCWIDAEWAEQLTSGIGTYTVDSEGYLVYTATGERVSSTFDSSMTAEGLFDGSELDCLVSGESFNAWKYENTVISDKTAMWTDIIPALSEGDVTITLTAQISVSSTKPEPEPEPAPVYKVSVGYRIPLSAVESAGYLGLWKHTDTEGKLSVRSDHSTSAGRVGYIDPEAEFIVTEVYEGADYLWGKLTYNGVSGWCALSDEWSEQLTSGAGTYTVDADGYLIYTASGERVTAELSSDDSISELLDTALIELMKDGISLDGWSADGKYISDPEALLGELVSSPDGGDVSITLSARMTGISGDADGNGVTDEHDLDLLVRYLSGYDDNLALANLDINGDGKINTRDFMLIKKTIA